MKKGLIRKCILLAATVGLLSAGMIVNAEESYTVKAGDNLSKIAKEVYGDSTAWKTIYEANKASIKDPNVIYKGQVFAIPGGTAEASVTTEEDAAAAAAQAEAVAAAAAAQAEADAATAAAAQASTDSIAWVQSLYNEVRNIREIGNAAAVVNLMGNWDNLEAQLVAAGAKLVDLAGSGTYFEKCYIVRFANGTYLAVPYLDGEYEGNRVTNFYILASPDGVNGCGPNFTYNSEYVDKPDFSDFAGFNYDEELNYVMGLFTIESLYASAS